MPTITREFVVEAPPKATWEYVSDMEKFSNHLPGFEEFEEVDETTSLWTVKVDLSMFSRVMTFEVDVVTEDYPQGEFEMVPQDQPAEGSGSVYLAETENGHTQIELHFTSEASGRMAPFLNKVIEKALHYVGDEFIDSLQSTEIPTQKVASE